MSRCVLGARNAQAFRSIRQQTSVSAALPGPRRGALISRCSHAFRAAWPGRAWREPVPLLCEVHRSVHSPRDLPPRWVVFIQRQLHKCTESTRSHPHALRRNNITVADAWLHDKAVPLSFHEWTRSEWGGG